MTLKNLNLEVKEGEFVCIIGETGCGKTSLLQAIIGDMMAVSEETVKGLGGADKTKTAKEFVEL